MNDYPKLRQGLEAFPVHHEGRQVVLLRDRLGYCAESLLIPRPLAALLLKMDGTNSLRDLQLDLMRMTGELLYIEKLQEFVDRLDEHLFLDNERFSTVVASELRDYLNLPVRRMQHVGKSYPGDPGLFQEQMRRLFSEIPSPFGTQSSLGMKTADGRPLLALVAPHIDISAGGVSFAHAYTALLESLAPTTWVILGTGHEPVENHFALTVKDFETPLGVLPCDREICESLINRFPRDIRAGEYNHRREHTIEFQAVFLGYVQPSCRIVPVLCSFGVEEWARDRHLVDEFAALLRGLILEPGRSVGIIASVDLAHIGPRYGDGFLPTPHNVEEHLKADRDLLGYLEKCDAAGFMQAIIREGNRRRICGTAPLYVLAKALENMAEGALLDHRYAAVDQHRSFVTFASMAFYPTAG